MKKQKIFTIALSFFLSTQFLISSDLNFYVFNVGTANFTLLTKDDCALVVDIGQKNQELGEDLIQQKLVTIFKDILLCKILITHNHDDHYNLINTFIHSLHQINTSRIKNGKCPIILEICNGWEGRDIVANFLKNTVYESTGFFIPGPKEDTLHYIKKNSYYFYLLRSSTYFTIIISDRTPPHISGKTLCTLKQCEESETSSKSTFVAPDKFFDGVSFNVFNPKDFSNTFLKPSDPHQQHLILQVCYRGKSILFTGDAGSSLLSHHLIKIEGFLAALRSTNILVLPHHGSWDHGEQFWFDAVNSNETIEKFYIISGNPAKQYNIPKMSYINRILSYLPENLTNEHNIVMSTIDDKDPDVPRKTSEIPTGTGGSGGIRAAKRARPARQTTPSVAILQNLYITCCAQSGYYKFTINYLYEGIKVSDGLKLIYPTHY